MISVSADFKTAMKASVKEPKAYIYDPSDTTYIRDDYDLKYSRITANGDFLRTVMRQADFHFFGSHNYLDKYVNVGMGVVLANDTTEYIDYGSFKVVEQKQVEGGDYIQAKGYDYMYEALRLYDLAGQDYPITLLEFLQAICDRLGWTLATTSFHNDSLSVTADPYILLGTFTFRDVLEQIAEATASIIRFNVDDELELIQPGTSSVETLEDEIKELKIKPVWGALNSVVIADVPGDFVWSGGYYYERILNQDGGWLLDQAGDPLGLQRLFERQDLFQLRAENNLLLTSPSSQISGLFTELTGIQYYPFEAGTFGFGYLEVGDKITVVDIAETSYATYVMNSEIEFSENGFSERLWADLPFKSKKYYNEDPGVIRDVISKSELDTRNYRDESITSAKVESLIADKIATGTLRAVATLGESDSEAGIVLDGENIRQTMTDSSGNMRLILGQDFD